MDNIIKFNATKRLTRKGSTDENLSNGSTNLLATPRNLADIESSAN